MSSIQIVLGPKSPGDRPFVFISPQVVTAFPADGELDRGLSKDSRVNTFQPLLKKTFLFQTPFERIEGDDMIAGMNTQALVFRTRPR